MRTHFVVLALSLAACGMDMQEHEGHHHEGTGTALRANEGLCAGGLFHLQYGCHGGAARRGTNTLDVNLTDAHGAALAGATIAVTPYMPAHGHGSSTTPKVTDLGGGAYRVEDVVLTMAGEWHLTFDVKEGARHDELVFALDVP